MVEDDGEDEGVKMMLGRVMNGDTKLQECRAARSRRRM